MKFVFSPLLALAAVLAAPLAAQYASAPTNDADLLAAQMRVIGANPSDVVALTQAGELSTRLGDLSGAASLFARADKVDPRNGRVKAGLGGVLLHLERPGEALQYYNQAEGYGFPVARFAADRGLAYDLVAQQARAQRDYRLSLASGAGDDETVRRYALSLGISGQKEAALHLLDPLLRRNDRAGWRARAFVLAMNGEAGAAQTIATTMMAPGQASGMAAFFTRLPAMSPADRAFAVQFGELRPTPQRLADLRLAPALPALVPEVVAVPRPAPVVQVAAAAKPDKHKRGRRGETQLAAAVPPPAAPALPAPPAYGVYAPAVAAPARALPASFGAAAPLARAPSGYGPTGPASSSTALAALSPRALPPGYDGPGRAFLPAGAIAARVLPARSPLPPPPTLPAQAALAVRLSDVALARAMPGQSSAATRATPVPPVAKVAPVVPPMVVPVNHARGSAGVGGGLSPRRPSPMLPNDPRFPGTPVASPVPASTLMAAPIPAVASTPSAARITGTLGAPGTASTAAVAPAVKQSIAPIAGVTIGTAPPSAGASRALAMDGGGQRVTGAAIPPVVASAPVVRALPPLKVDGDSFGTTARAPTTSALAASPSGPLVPDHSAFAPVTTRLSLIGPSVPGVALNDGSGTVARPPVSGTGQDTPVAGGDAVKHPEVSGLAASTATIATPAAASLDNAIPSASPSTSQLGTNSAAPSMGPGGGEELAGIAVTRAGTATAIATVPPTVVAGTVVTPVVPAAAVASSASPAVESVLARIVSAIPVPASELNVAPTTTKRHAARHLAVAAADPPAKPRAEVGARKRDMAVIEEGATSGRGKEHKPSSNADDAHSTGRSRHSALARADEDAPAAAHGRHGHDAAIAKADDDGAASRHGRHARHDTSEDDAPKLTKRGAAKSVASTKHEAEPQKYWVQVAGGANEASLGKAWSIAQAKAPALAKRKGYTAPLHATNRVLAGPFKDDGEARAFVNTLNKQGVHAFQFTNDKRQKVKRLDDE